LAPSCVSPGKSLKQFLFSVLHTLCDQSHPGKSVVLCFQPLTYFYPNLRRAPLSLSFTRAKIISLRFNHLRTLCTKHPGVPLFFPIWNSGCRPPRSWSLPIAHRFALPALSSYNKVCLFRSKSSLPSSQPYLRHTAHGDVPQCY